MASKRLFKDFAYEKGLLLGALFKYMFLIFLNFVKNRRGVMKQKITASVVAKLLCSAEKEQAWVRDTEVSGFSV